MLENAETRKAACEQPGDPVREDDVDLREPSLPKLHHQNASGNNGDITMAPALMSFQRSLLATPQQPTLSRLIASREPVRPARHQRLRTETLPRVLGARSHADIPALP